MGREGLSIDKSSKKPLLQHLDDRVAEKYPEIDKQEWNRTMMKEVREDLLKELYNSCGIKSRPDTRQEFDPLVEDTIDKQDENAMLVESPERLERIDEEDENIDENLKYGEPAHNVNKSFAPVKRKKKTVQNVPNDPEDPNDPDWEQEDKKSKKEKKKKKKKARRAILSSDDESDNDGGTKDDAD